MASVLVNTDLDFNGVARILALPDPTLAQHPATKAYVDSAVEGLAWKDSVRVASVANINLASPGTTIDGITMATNDRFLAKDQTLPEANGIYIWNGSAVAATRALDMSVAAEVEQAVVTVEEGTAAGSTFRQTQVNVTLGTTGLVFTSFGTAAPTASETTAGVSEFATQGEVDTGTDTTRTVRPNTLANWSGRKLKYAADIGDGSSTSIAVTHNLGTLDVQAVVKETGGSLREVMCEKRYTSTTVMTFVFDTAPASAAYRVIILG